MLHLHKKTDRRINVHNESTKVTRAASSVAVVTFLSRVSGYVRDMLFAFFFGVGMLSDAFIAAFRIPNLFRRLLGEGSLNLVFIPIFTKYFTKGEYVSAYKLAERALRFLFVLLAFVSLLGVVFSPLILNLMAPGFSMFPQKMEITLKLTRIMFPFIIFVGMAALCTGILNVLGYFAIPAFAPVLLNITMILFLYAGKYLCFTGKSLVIGLSICVLVGGGLQLALQMPFLAKNDIHLFKNFKIWHPEFKKIGYAILPTIFGSAVYQINTIMSTILASFLPEGSVACLYYADRIVQFPLGIFAYALATAALPSLSRQASLEDLDSLGSIVGYTMSLLFFITIPATVGLIVLRQPIVSFLFGRGAFTTSAIISTSHSLLCYSIGLWAFAAVKVVVPVFFALRDTVTPVKMGTFSIILNICLGFLLMNFLGHCGLALATSIASIVNLFLLIYSLTKNIVTIPWASVFISISKTIFCTTLMAISVIGVRQLIIPTLDVSRLYLTAGLFSCILVGVLVFAIFAFIMKMPQLRQIVFLLGISKKLAD